MKAYLDLAERYFVQFEGRNLYPGWKSWRFWVWIACTTLWGVSLWAYAKPGHIETTKLLAMLAAEVVWLVAGFNMSAWKDRRAVAIINARLGTNFKKMIECRLVVLREIVPVPRTDYLRFVKDMSEAKSLNRAFKRYSDFEPSEIWKAIYDRDSKARLLALTIAVISMLVALVAKSNVTLDTLFDLYSEPSVTRLLSLVESLAVVIFAIFVGFKIFALSVADFFMSWSIRLFGKSVFSDWLLAYLARDLLRFHTVGVDTPSPPEKTMEGDSAPEGTVSQGQIKTLEGTASA